MSYAIYNRKSQENEERQVQSIDSQRDLNVKLVASLGLEVSEGHDFEESFSAKEPGRPVFNRLLELVRQGDVDGIVAWHPDRLSRNELDAAQVCYMLRKGLLKDLKFVNYTFVNSPEGIMMLQMALSQSQYQVSKLSIEVLRGLGDKMKRGELPQRAYEGYRNDLEYHTIVPDPERLPLIRRAFDLLLTGAYNVEQVRRTMNEDWGYRTRRAKKIGGKRLTKSAADRMFKNVFYTGRILRKGKVHRGSHAAILTVEEFDRVQSLLGRHQYRRRTFAFNGVMRCVHCRRAVVGSLQKGHVYYACGNARCPAGRRRSIREEVLELQIAEVLRGVTWPEWFGDVVRDEVRAFFRDEVDEHERNAARRTEELARLQRRRSDLLDLKLDGTVDVASFEFKDRELSKEIATLQRSLSQGTDRMNTVWGTVNAVVDYVVYAEKTFRLGDPLKQREIVAVLGSQYAFDNGKVTIEVNPLLPHGLAPLKPRIVGSHKQKSPLFEAGSSEWLGMRDWIQNIIAPGAVFPRLASLTETAVAA